MAKYLWSLICLMTGILLGAAITPDSPWFPDASWGIAVAIFTGVISGIISGVCVSLWSYEAVRKMEVFNHYLMAANDAINEVYFSVAFNPYELMSDSEQQEVLSMIPAATRKLRNIQIDLTEEGFTGDSNFAGIARSVLMKTKDATSDDIESIILEAGRLIKDKAIPAHQIWGRITWATVKAKYLKSVQD